jgi:hypothetical protein
LAKFTKGVKKRLPPIPPGYLFSLLPQAEGSGNSYLGNAPSNLKVISVFMYLRLKDLAAVYQEIIRIFVLQQFYEGIGPAMRQFASSKPVAHFFAGSYQFTKQVQENANFSGNKTY